MKKMAVWLAIGVVLLGGVAVAEPVTLPPAADEVAAMREAFTPMIEFLEGLIVELKGAVTSLNTADKTLTARYEALAIELKNAEGQIVSLRKDFDSRVSALDQRLAGDEQTIADLQSRLSSLESEVQQIRDQLMAVAGQMADHELRIAKLESEDFGAIQRRLLALEQSVQALGARVENNRQKIDGLEIALAGFTTDIEAVKSSVADLQGLVDGQEARLAAVEAQVEGLDVKAVQDSLGMAQGLAIVGLLAGVAALVLVLMGGG